MIFEIATLAIGLATFLQTYWLWRLQRKATQDDDARAQEKSRVDAMESTIAAKADQIIQQKIALAVTEFHGSVREFKLMLEQVKERLNKGDDAFDQQEDKAHHLELEAAKREGQLRQWVLVTFGTKEEINHALGGMRLLDGRLNRLEASLKP